MKYVPAPYHRVKETDFMKKISYRYTNSMKQILFIMGLIYFFLRMVVMAEIIIFKIPGYYENVNIPLTIVFYAVLFAVLFLIFMGYKFFLSTYDENSVTYYNRFLRKERSMPFSQARLAVFGSRGVSFYASEDGNETGEHPIFFIPFFRGGIIDAIEINDFFKDLKAREDIKVIKKFSVLPGYSKKWYILKIIYGFLAVIALVQCSTPLYVVIILFQNH